MAGGLVGLLDDVAAIAKLAADRELPIIRKIAIGSIRNKLVFILPAALILSELVPTLVEIILMCGGAFLAYEGAHKVIHALKHDDHEHDVPVALKGPEAEKSTVSGAIRTDFILSAEIMVISLKEVIDEPLLSRAMILVVVAFFITIAVYGVVALIVKMDDIGLALTMRQSATAQKTGRLMVIGMPKVLKVLSIVGTAAMLWVGGHILLAGSDELGWHGPYDVVHDLEHTVHDTGALAGVLEWTINTMSSAVIGFAVGALIVGVVALLPFGKPKAGTAH
jgi:predicted DNA repair protein MutK